LLLKASGYISQAMSHKIYDSQPMTHKQLLYSSNKAPIQGTFGDFWKMIWQQDARFIIMLTNLVEGGRVRADQYWPFDDEKEEVAEGLWVELEEQKIGPNWSDRHFIISNKDEIRNIHQIQFNNFLSFSDIPDSKIFFDFLKYFQNEYNQTLEYGPILVHCSDGCSRTGLFIAIDQLLDSIEKDVYVDIKGLVYAAKTARHLLVKNIFQYKYLYQFLNAKLLGKFEEIGYLNEALEDDITSSSDSDDSSSIISDTDESVNSIQF